MTENSKEIADSPGTLAEGETHPAAYIALKFIQSIPLSGLIKFQETFASLSIDDETHLAGVYSETLRRLLAKEPISDRYLMGLAWCLLDIVAEGNIEVPGKAETRQ